MLGERSEQTSYAGQPQDVSRQVSAPPPARILVIEDDAPLQALLARSLARAGYTPLVAGDGGTGLQRFRAQAPALVLLDLVLPDMLGIVVCRTIRAESAVPILVISGLHGEQQQVALFDAGADDYLLKPVPRELLLARIRRALVRSAAPVAAAPTLISVGALRIDLVRHQAWCSDAPLQLPPSEWMLLTALAQAPAHTLTIAQLCRQLWPDEANRDGSALHPVVTRLRRKLAGALTIVNLRGAGYRLEAAPS